MTGMAILVLCGYPYLRNAYLEVYRNAVPFRENIRAVTETAVRYQQYYRDLEASDLRLDADLLTVVNPYRYNLPLLFYSRVAALHARYTLVVPWEEPSPFSFRSGDTVVNCDSRAGTRIRERYVIRALHQAAGCETLLVIAETGVR